MVQFLSQLLQGKTFLDEVLRPDGLTVPMMDFVLKELVSEGDSELALGILAYTLLHLEDWTEGEGVTAIWK